MASSPTHSTERWRTLPRMPVTMPIGSSRARSTGPCSMCSSSQAWTSFGSSRGLPASTRRHRRRRRACSRAATRRCRWRAWRDRPPTFTEQRVGAHIGPAESRAFLAPQGISLESPTRFEAFLAETRENRQPAITPAAPSKLPPRGTESRCEPQARKGSSGSEPSSVMIRLAPASRSVARPSACACPSTRSSAALSLAP